MGWGSPTTPRSAGAAQACAGCAIVPICSVAACKSRATAAAAHACCWLCLMAGPDLMAQEPTPSPIRLVLADDHRLFREGVASLLERVEDIELVGQVATGEDAVRLVTAVQPHIVLMDLQMPGMGGIEATRAIAAAHPVVGVIVLTMFEDDELVFAAIRAGARGYVLSDADRGSLLRAIRAVASGEALLWSGRGSKRVLQHLAV